MGIKDSESTYGIELRMTNNFNTILLARLSSLDDSASSFVGDSQGTASSHDSVNAALVSKEIDVWMAGESLRARVVKY